MYKKFEKYKEKKICAYYSLHFSFIVGICNTMYKQGYFNSYNRSFYNNLFNVFYYRKPWCKIIKSTNLKLYEFEIKKELIEGLKLNFGEKANDINIVLKNDAKIAATAEKKYGVLKEYRDGIFLTIGTGIGGACYINNKLIEPKRYSGFEYGHMIIEFGGKKCSCGAKGCFERYASITALKESFRKEFNFDKTHEITGKELCEFIEFGMKNDIISWKIEEILDNYTKNLALGISNLINIFEPEIVVLGGSIVYYEELLLQKIKENLFVFNREGELPELKMAVLGNDAGVIGN